MAQISFKADSEFNTKLKIAAKVKGISTSAYIKLILKKQIDTELSQISVNGLTAAEEEEILNAVKSTEIIGPFSDVEDAISALNKL